MMRRVVQVVLLTGDHHVLQYRARQGHVLDPWQCFILDGSYGFQGELAGVQLACEEVGETGRLLQDAVPDHLVPLGDVTPVIPHCLHADEVVGAEVHDLPRPSAYRLQVGLVLSHGLIVPLAMDGHDRFGRVLNVPSDFKSGAGAFEL